MERWSKVDVRLSKLSETQLFIPPQALQSKTGNLQYQSHICVVAFQLKRGNTGEIRINFSGFDWIKTGKSQYVLHQNLLVPVESKKLQFWAMATN